MLILGRKVNERVVIGEGTPFETTITVTRMNGGTVWLGLDAPSDVNIVRHELLQRRNDATKPIRQSRDAETNIVERQSQDEAGSVQRD